MPSPIEVIVEDGAKTDWRPSPFGAPADPVPATPMPTAEIELALGHSLVRASSPEVDEIASSLNGPWSTYFADFAPGAALTYRRRTTQDDFWVTQHIILTVKEPSRYIYNDAVRVERIELDGGPAVMWRPLFDSQMVSYIDWYRDDMLISLNFRHGTSRAFMLRMAHAMV